MPKWFRPTFITAGIIAGLYAPFELTRVLLDLKAGYIPIVPWWIWWEIAAIWLGFIVMVTFLLITGRKSDEN